MWTTTTATNLHVLDGGIAWVYDTIIPSHREQHAKPCAAAADALVWHRRASDRIHGGYQVGPWFDTVRPHGLPSRRYHCYGFTVTVTVGRSVSVRR